MPQYDDGPDVKAVAAANLSMTTIYVAPDGTHACIELPSSKAVRCLIGESLKTLGFDLGNPSGSDIAILTLSRGSSDTPGEAIRHDNDVWLTKQGLDKLIEAGVTNRSLDALTGRKATTLIDDERNASRGARTRGDGARW
jgi:hypothetical protein